MINIQLHNLEKYKDNSKFEQVEKNIYKDLNDQDATNHRIAFSFELEEGEDSQYPLEDLLDKYYLHVSDFVQYGEGVKLLKLELAGELEDIRKVAAIAGKRVYNHFYEQDGNKYAKLVIE